MLMPDLSVIVPCYNEEANVENLALKVLELFNKHAVTGEIIFINDGSFDKTDSKICELTRLFKNILCVNHVRNLGIVESWNSGLRASQGRYVLTIDADFQYAPDDIWILYKYIKENAYDLIQGWRWNYKDKNLIRRFLSRSLSCLLNMLFFTRLNDIKSGFVIYKRDVFSDILKERRRCRTFQHFFILYALKKGYRLKQIPVAFYPRMSGASFIKNPLFFSCKVLLDIPRVFLDIGVMPGRGSY